MNKNINYEIYKELYEVTLKIKEMEPWKYFYDKDLITIIMPGQEEPVYCSIMGRGKEHYGIGVYPGFYPLLGLLKITDGKIPEHQYARYNNNLQCIFGNLNQVSKEEHDLIKDLGYNFRGKNNWTFFESNVKGYMPTMINIKEAQFMLDVFKNLYMVLKRYFDESMEVDFEKGESLYRKYDPKSGLWYTYVAPLYIPEVEDKSYLIEDELLIARLRNKKRNVTTIEIDAVYLNTPTRDNEYNVPLLPRMTVCADQSNGTIVNQYLSNVIESMENEDLIEMIKGYIKYYGRPIKVMVRDEFIKSVLSDLCEKLDIKLEISEKMFVIDDFINKYINVYRK